MWIGYRRGWQFRDLSVCSDVFLFGVCVQEDDSCVHVVSVSLLCVFVSLFLCCQFVFGQNLGCWIVWWQRLPWCGG